MAGRNPRYNGRGGLYPTYRIEKMTGICDNMATLSVATPSVTFQNDTNTGLFRNTSDNIVFVTGGSSRISVDNTAIYALNPIVLSGTFTPTGTADGSGTTNQIAYDSSYIYIKTSAGWKRATLNTF